MVKQKNFNGAKLEGFSKLLPPGARLRCEWGNGGDNLTCPIPGRAAETAVVAVES